MKKVWLGVAVALVAAVAGVLRLWVFTPRGAAAAARTEQWLQAVHDKARDGYWLVVRGSHVGDNIVAIASGESLSHATVYDREHDQVIEAIAQGVTVTPVRSLLAEAARLDVIEPQGFTVDDGKAALARARSHVGRGYDWLGLIGRPEKHRYYCTELAVDAWQGRKRGWPLENPIRPESMPGLGRVVYQSER